IARLCATTRALWQEQRAYWLSWDPVGERLDFHGGFAGSRRKPFERRIQKARALQYARRQYFADRRDGPRPSRRIWPWHVRAAWLWRHFLRRPRSTRAGLRLACRRS